MKPTRLDYCQYLLVSPINHTLTHFAGHTERMSHDAINRFLRDDKITPRLVWDNVRDSMVFSDDGYLVFDDTIIDKNYSHQIELVRRQYSGNTYGIIKGIGVVACVYINAQTEQHWIIGYRIYDPDGDGKSRLDHVRGMLTNAVHDKRLPFRTVLMDTWYAAKDLTLFVESLHKRYHCPLKGNRQVDDSGGQKPCRRVESLPWSGDEIARGKVVKIKGFPMNHKVKLFRVEVSTHRTDWVVTNDLSQGCAQATQQVCGLRWKIEQFHRETKQLTGLERCQCRKARIQRNRIACAILVWVRLAQIARQTKRTLYQVKHGLLDGFPCQQLKNPSLKRRLA